MRAIRAVRTSDSGHAKSGSSTKASEPTSASTGPSLGDALFRSKPSSTTKANPFPSTSATLSSPNPFSSAPALPTQSSSINNGASANNLVESFAEKARISTDSKQTTEASASTTPEPWTADPTPYPSYYVDADKEYLESTSQNGSVPSNARVDTDGESSSAADEKAAFESAMDKTFQRFADRLSQNPEQVLRYEFAGQPLLYSKSDSNGKLLASNSEGNVRTVTSSNSAGSGLKIPRCSSCGAGRVFELQLTPHAITELEAEETSLDGMDWGTIIVAVCSEDCQEKSKADGDVGYVEEWVGVQWEEVTDHKKR